MEAGHGEVIHVDSAGTLSYHAGNPADYRMREAAARRGYSLDSIARQVTHEDILDFDLIVPMDHDNLSELERMAEGPRSHLRLLGSFLGKQTDNRRSPPVPDPYYGGEQGFEDVLNMIEAACPALLEHCLALLHEK